MDIATILGIIIGLAALIGGFLWEGGELGGLMQIASAVIVLGGTLAAVMVSYPLAKLKTVPRALALAFTSRKEDTTELIEELVGMSTIARREGVLALEQKAAEHQNPFLKESIQLVVDGTEQSMVKQIMDLEIDAIQHKYEGYAKIFESAGGYAPTMGIIGTVMGLIHVLGSLSEPTALGPSIALAFTATLYGVASANLIFLPIASKLKDRGEEEVARMEMMLEGVLSLQNGDHPILVRRKLESYTAGARHGLPQSGETESV
ncbi:motility protein A [Paenibacillus faecis]|uniref:Flagellar motor protein n=1 Tax=Paenibacillus faecis TaxID=862114 RepID=A0A5D0CR73_9BACL|nr:MULTISPECIES: flagellar motor protein [Paenibacillus]MCA1293937.1 flagellar motor protein [Paenibacillus sp. alder61]TYA11824.1 flagellar motor protein [Paenibacillus faecis]GIO88512.1 motility protein A [Paenibacillus faecis]